MNRLAHSLKIWTLATWTLAIWTILATAAAVGQELSTIDQQKPFTMGGAVNTNLTASTISGAPRRQDPFSWTVGGSLTPALYGVQLPFSFIFSSQSKSYTQPFNQFGISPSYKSLRTHLGYRSMNFSRYTMSGTTFFGAGMEFNAGPVRSAAMVGRFKEAIDEDTLNPSATPSYQRNGYAVKLGFGSERTFFEASYLHAADDTNSLRKAPTKGDAPAENSALGGTMRFGITNSIAIEAEGGASLYTSNLRAAGVDVDSASSIPDFLTGIYQPRVSTSFTMAGRVGVSWTESDYGVRVGYEYVEPDYATLGAYSFTTDISNWTIAPSLNLLNSALRLSGSVGLQSDNVLGNKLAQTERVIGSFNAGYNSGDWGVDASYSNYSTNQKAGRAPISDSIRARNIMQSATLAPRLTLQSEDLSQTVALSTGYQEYSDLNAFTSALTDNRALTAAASYNVAFLKSKTNVGGSLVYANTQSGLATSNTLSASLNGALTMLANDELSLNGTLSYSTSSVTGTDGASSTIALNIGSTYQLTKEDNINLSFNATTNGNTMPGATGFTELSSSLSYSRSFNIFN